MDAPVANPSSPSVKLTPLLADITMMTIHMIAKPEPK